ncbi:MAG: SLBB domain-containing protein [Planctomycetota bacterium]|nr:SLBB domain-containing protein [Planctomycetota bacterium]
MSFQIAWRLLPTLICLPGCASSVYHASSLPAELEAPPVNNVHTVDLSRLSGFAVSNELIEPGDVLEVTIVAGITEHGPLTIPVRVSDNGSAGIPLLGEVALAGMELEQAEQAIRAAAVTQGVYRNPHVTVVMEKKRVNKITVVGAVEKPGTYELPRGSSDLLAALVAASGLSEEAGTEVEIRSPARRLYGLPNQRQDLMASYPGQPPAPDTQLSQPRSLRINLMSASQSGQEVNLADGDVVMVLKRDPNPIQVMGLVRKPNKYELPTNREMYVLDAIAGAGGVSSQLADKVFVIRRLPGSSDTSVIKVSIRRAKRDSVENIRLASGDVVSVEQTPSTVALDAVRNFVHFSVGASTRVPFF